MRHTLKHYLRLIFLFTIPLTIVLIAFSEIIVKILFQRGSFTAIDTQLVAQIQSFFALQIPFYTAGILVVRLILAMQINIIIMWGSACNLIINIVLDYVFAKWIGITGIALSTSCVYIFSCLFLFSYAQIKLSKKPAF